MGRLHLLHDNHGSLESRLSNRVHLACRRLIVLVCLVIECLAPSVSAAQASPTGNTELAYQINSAIEQWINDQKQQHNPSLPGRIEFSVGTIDRRLSLPLCQSTPTVTPMGNPLARRVTLRIQCSFPQWQTHVPVAQKRWLEVYVSQMPVRRGTTLTQGHIRKQLMDISGLAVEPITDANLIIGYTATRTLTANQVLTPGLLTPPHVVSKGDTVLIESVSRLISVRARGMALANGSIGQRISVKNLNSQQVVEGVVIKAGLVRAQ